MNTPIVWFVRATQPTPHHFITLERSRADDYALLHKGTIHRFVEQIEVPNGQTRDNGPNF